MTLMVNGTLASELRTRFWPMRLTYSLTTGSCTILAVCSTIMAYCLPIFISVSVEYQSPKPRLPTLRLPMASTSFLLPLFTFGAVAGASEVVLAGASVGEALGVCAEFWFGSELAAGGAVDGVCVLLCAMAGIAMHRVNNHAVNTDRARAFMGNSSPERFLTYLTPLRVTCSFPEQRRSCATPESSIAEGSISGLIICPIWLVKPSLILTTGKPPIPR